ncbi:MAG TPA: type II toxin-antitoxin system VapC family toxin [Caulobacteraceae bacterium]|nr:type II toxin-antitoxin system VapC family toxin [Caulobacteraceae bacterium]
MRLLLDTHVILWALDDFNLLSDEMISAARALPSPTFVASAASLWEIAIKVAKGKLHAPADLPAKLRRDGFEILEVTAEHAWAVRTAPAAVANKDPFDRLIFTQAKLERLTLATRDEVLLRSGLDVIRA